MKKLKALLLKIGNCQLLASLRGRSGSTACPSVVLHCRTKEGQLFIIFLSLFTILYSLFPINAFAQTAPQACAFPQFTSNLTKITSQPYSFIIKRFIPKGVTQITIIEPLGVQVNFSELPAIFSDPNSNFLESRYQDPLHNTAATSSLDPARFNAFHGPSQKAGPAYLIDDLKITFIQYLAKSPWLDENNDTYTDASGQNPRRAADLIAAYGGSPQPPSHGGSQTAWQTTWGPYWDKIPTAVNEYFWAFFQFLPPFESQNEIRRWEQNLECRQTDRQVFFPMPNYFRTTSTSNQINQLFLPKAAQSSDADFMGKNLFVSKEDQKSKLSQIVNKLGKPLTEALKKILKISFSTLSPVKNAFAQADCQQPGDVWDPATGTCQPGIPAVKCARPLAIMPNQKRGEGPFCSLPALVSGKPMEQFFSGSFMQVPDPLSLNNPSLYQQRRQEGMPDEPQFYTNESCNNITENNLDNGFLDDCTFRRTYFRTLRSPDHPLGQDPLWDFCQPRIEIDEFGNAVIVGYDCQISINIYLIYWIPWLAPIWNNTTHSDESVVQQQIVIGTGQVTNRPGSYNLFTPKSVEGTIFPDSTGKQLPSQDDDISTAPKQRFFGAVDNFKKFVRDCALKPKALQTALGIECQGEIQSGGATRPPTIIGDPAPVPPPPPPVDPGPGYDYPLDDITFGWF